MPTAKYPFFPFLVQKPLGDAFYFPNLTSVLKSVLSHSLCDGAECWSGFANQSKDVRFELAQCTRAADPSPANIESGVETCSSLRIRALSKINGPDRWFA